MVICEKVVDDLQEAAAYFRSSFDAMYGTVACEKFRGWTDAIEQALALLKAQEARVMTLEEAFEADYVYLEVRIHTKIPCCILALDKDGDIVPLKRGFSGIFDAVSYGKCWRCWTSRPSDEQREAEPWE